LKLQVKFSDQLEKRFAELLTHYPIKRSALIPMLLYAQDEVGCVNDEVVHEIAVRLDLTDLEVRNVVSYYSMLHTKPIGKYNIQLHAAGSGEHLRPHPQAPGHRAQAGHT
jgi:NADH-quinone oxidoreductase subunit E